jgi:hypothetical protein
VRRTVLFSLAVLVVIAVLTHRTWLAAIGDGLVAHDDLESADVIVVLAGSSSFRARHAEMLYARGLAPSVIISNEPLSSHGVQMTWLELRERGLVNLAIPDVAIVPILVIDNEVHLAE